MLLLRKLVNRNIYKLCKCTAITASIACLLLIRMTNYANAQPAAPSGWKLSSTPSKNTTYVAIGSGETAIITISPPLAVQSLDQLLARGLQSARPINNCGALVYDKAIAIDGVQAKLIPTAPGGKYQCSAIGFIRGDNQGQIVLMVSIADYDHSGKTEAAAVELVKQLAATSNGQASASGSSNRTSPAVKPSPQPVDKSKANDIALALQTLAPVLDKNGESAKGINPSDIQSIRFDMFDITSVRPLILLKNKIVCDCAEFSFDVLDLAAVARKNPNDIGQWRIGDNGKIQIKWTKSKDWSGLSFPDSTGKPLGDNWKANITYKAISTSGFGMAGGDNSAFTAVSSMMSFGTDGRFSEGSVVSSTVESGGGRTVAGGKSAARGGRYKVEGWNLVLSYDDGKVQKLTAITDKDPSTIWLGGKSWVSR